jgi:hypothetical protein
MISSEKLSDREKLPPISGIKPKEPDDRLSVAPEDDDPIGFQTSPP